VNGRVEERVGNSDTAFAPHGVYPAAGDDNWVAIVCRDDDDWRRLCAAMEDDDLARNSRYASAAGRLAHRDAIDSSIAKWSRALDRSTIESRLQSHGVPAHQVQNSADAYADPQFKHRGHFVALDHPSLGKFTVEGPRAKLSRTPAAVRRMAPSLGQDNQYVLQTILGYGETQITELVASGALG
jgi:crotonobetainyl-CoA:carnitine CoA-transferase CaiB-like acyl-CoA transferase